MCVSVHVSLCGDVYLLRGEGLCMCLSVGESLCIGVGSVCECVSLCGRGLCVGVCLSLWELSKCGCVSVCGKGYVFGGSVGVGISLEGRVCMGVCVVSACGICVSCGGPWPECLSVRASVCRSACLCPCVCFQWAECTEHSPLSSSRMFLSPQKDTPYP